MDSALKNFGAGVQGVEINLSLGQGLAEFTKKPTNFEQVLGNLQVYIKYLE